MKNNNLSALILFVFGYIILSVVISFLGGSLLNVMLGINVAFAITPMILITLVYKRLEKQGFSIDAISVIGFIAFIFFFPNTFYIITDFIHIDSIDFYTNYEYGNSIYVESIEPYITLFHILFSVIIGIYAGIKSLLIFEEILKKKGIEIKVIQLIIVITLLLSSTGIYIGRFLRFFSWEVFNPINLLSDIYDSRSLFMFTFIVVFTFVQLLLYYGYKLLFEKEPIS